MSAKKPREIYTIEFRQEAVRLALSGEKSIAQTARDLGINQSTIHIWIGKYRDEVVPTVETTLNLNQALLTLQKENRRLQEERDSLKKVTAYFASQSLRGTHS